MRVTEAEWNGAGGREESSLTSWKSLQTSKLPLRKGPKAAGVVIVVATSSGDETAEGPIGLIRAPGVGEWFGMMVWCVGGYAADHGGDGVGVVGVSGCWERGESFAGPGGRVLSGLTD